MHYQEEMLHIEGWNYVMHISGRPDEAKLLGICRNLAKCGVNETNVNSDRT